MDLTTVNKTLFSRLPREILIHHIQPFLGCWDHFNPLDGHFCICQKRFFLFVENCLPNKRTNQSVICKWMNGFKGRSNNMSTDGLVLYSYAMVIGVTERNTNRKCVFMCTAQHHWFVSLTTSNHVNMAHFYADVGVPYPTLELVQNLTTNKYLRGELTSLKWTNMICTVISDLAVKQRAFPHLPAIAPNILSH